jgi:hypothetical protein
MHREKGRLNLVILALILFYECLKSRVYERG